MCFTTAYGETPMVDQKWTSETLARRDHVGCHRAEGHGQDQLEAPGLKWG